MADKIAELRAKLEAKQKELAAIFAEAGPDLDMDKVTTLTGDTRARVDQIGQRNKELEALGQELDQAVEVTGIAGKTQKLGDWLKDSHQPQPPAAHPGSGPTRKGLGDLFVESDAFKGYQRGSKQGPVVELKNYGLAELKTVMSTGAGWSVEDMRIARVIEEALRPIQVLDILPAGQTSVANVLFMEETTVTNAAAEVAESANGALITLPESALAFTEQTSPVRKIGHWIPVTDEQLEDVPAVRSWINTRLAFMVRQRLDSQVLVGNGAAPNLRGILNVVGIQTQAKGTDPTPDAIYKAITLVRVTGRASPNAIILHPNDWQDIRLLRTADGIYIFGSPIEPGPERLWGLRVVQTDAETQNTGLVGDFATFCQLFERRGVEISISTEHASYFIQGVSAVKAEMRVAFVVYRPAAFCTVTGI